MSTPEVPGLRRDLSLALLTLYGVGTTVGAGIYALMGEVAGLAGMRAALAFALASLLAAASALSFAELSARHPRSAGEAEYVREAWGTRGLPLAVGLLVALSGSVSAAAISNGFAGYFGVFVEAGRALPIALLVLALGLVAAWGIRVSVLAAAGITLLEVGGLAAVCWVARDSLLELPARLPELAPPASPLAWGPVLGAAVLAFYAFLGFEDMVNVAEEVQDVRRTLPLAILLTLGLTTALYVVVALCSSLTVPPPELAASGAPLVLVYERASGGSGAALGAIGVFAMVNGALVQIIMASRVLYGMASRGALPAVLARVERSTGTPVVATAVVAVVVLVLALWLPLAPLAETTSVLTLCVFALVNLALCRLKRREPAPPDVRVWPRWVPWTGFGVSLGFVLFELSRRLSG